MGFKGIRVGDFIPISDNGFWKYRNSPSKSLKKAVKLFNDIYGKVIVEIGTGVHGKMSGDSVLIWAKYSSAQQIIAIDLDPNRIEEVKRATRQYSNVFPVVADGIEHLKSFSSKIDLLYLDFWVPDQENSLKGSARAESYKEAYIAAKDKMNQCSIILIDDTDHVDPWKQSYIIPMARKDGYKVIYTGRQTLLKRDFE